MRVIVDSAHMELLSIYTSCITGSVDIIKVVEVVSDATSSAVGVNGSPQGVRVDDD